MTSGLSRLYSPPLGTDWYPNGQERPGGGQWALGKKRSVGPESSLSVAEGAGPSPTHVGELAAMQVESKRLDQEPWEPGGQEEEEDEDEGPTPAYLSQATELITQALQDEKAGAYPAALQGYRDGVHVLLQGVPGEQGVEGGGSGARSRMVQQGRESGKQAIKRSGALAPH